MAITLIQAPPPLRYTQNPLRWVLGTDSTNPFVRILVQVLVETYTGSGEWQFVAEVAISPTAGQAVFLLNDKLRAYLAPEPPIFFDGVTLPAHGPCKPYKLRWAEVLPTDQKTTDTFHQAVGVPAYYTLATALVEGNTLRIIAESTDVATLAAEVKLDSAAPINVATWAVEQDRATAYITVPAGITNSNIRIPSGITIRILRPGLVYSEYTTPRGILLGGQRREQFAKPLPPPADPVITAEGGIEVISIVLTTFDSTATHELWRSLTELGGYAPIATLAPGVSTYEDEDVADGTTYFYKAMAYNEDASSNFSNVAEATVLALFEIYAADPSNNNTEIG